MVIGTSTFRASSFKLQGLMTVMASIGPGLVHQIIFSSSQEKKKREEWKRVEFGVMVIHTHKLRVVETSQHATLQ